MKARWRSGDLIRDRDAGHPFFVIHVYKNVCTLIFDANQNSAVLPIGVLLKRDYGKFAKDIEMEVTKRGLLSEALTWKYKPLPKIEKKDDESI